MNPVRILGIAPYEGMRDLMVQLADRMEDVELTACVGDLEAGVAEVRARSLRDYDVILSRGGTAELIRAETFLPVVEIELSLYDLLRAIHLVESGSGSCALVGFPAITRNAVFLRDVLGYEIQLYTIHDEAEARGVLKQLAGEGCEMVLCDMIVYSLAHEYGLSAALIASGTESVESAIRHAVGINRSFRPLRDQADLMQAVLASERDWRLVLTDAGDTLFRSGGEEPEGLYQRCMDWLPLVLKDETRRFVMNAGGKQIQVTGRRVVADSRNCASFSARVSSIRLVPEKYGIRYLDREEVMNEFFNSFYGITQPGAAKLYEEYAQKAFPVVISGRAGTGKDQMAHLLYSQGKYRKAPLCVIDCALLQDRGFRMLIEEDRSPVMGEGHAVHFQRVEALPEERFRELFSYLRDTRFHLRNQVLFTASEKQDGILPNWVSSVMGWFDCTMIHLPLLREHKTDIHRLAALYINMLNTRNAREISGLDGEALRLLEDYDWPGNIDQFRRILQSLVMETVGSMIRPELVRRLLKQEELIYPAEVGQGFEEAVQGKTLDEVCMMAARQALADSKGNRSAAARQLGISRTSLWRLLQRTQEEAE